MKWVPRWTIMMQLKAACRICALTLTVSFTLQLCSRQHSVQPLSRWWVWIAAYNLIHRGLFCLLSLHGSCFKFCPILILSRMINSGLFLSDVCTSVQGMSSLWLIFKCTPANQFRPLEETWCVLQILCASYFSYGAAIGHYVTWLFELWSLPNMCTNLCDAQLPLESLSMLASLLG